MQDHQCILQYIHDLEAQQVAQQHVEQPFIFEAAPSAPPPQKEPQNDMSLHQAVALQQLQQLQLQPQDWAFIFAFAHQQQQQEEALAMLAAQPEQQQQQQQMDLQVHQPQLVGTKRYSSLMTSAPPPPSKKSKMTSAIVYKGTVVLIDDDGWEWSKYGQKKIRQSKFAVRHYYRCKKKGCDARKHVEQTLTHPIQSTVSYSGTHTCVECINEENPFAIDASSSNNSSDHNSSADS